MKSSLVQLFRGEIFYFKTSPLERADAYFYYLDGALIIADGKIVEAGPYEQVHTRYPDLPIVDYTGKLIMPGFIDSHIHYSQSEIIGMCGHQLLDWLNKYTFPAEQAFASEEHALEIARFFVDELLKNGTTTCMAYATVHPVSVSALFTVASAYNMRMMTGKVLMDRNAPDGLTDTLEQGDDDCRKLIESWHQNGRNQYVVTPRFAITSTLAQLKNAARLHAEYPDTYIQTHLSENKTEIESALSLCPGHKDYLEVYERVGLLTDRSVFGHCIHLSQEEGIRLSACKSVIAHCPTSNMFLGSGLFDMKQANQLGLQTTLGTDVGAGTSFSMFRTMGEAYKVQQLNGYSMSVFESFYKCTLGSARALNLEDKIGSFNPGCEADFIIVDCASTSAQRLRMDYLCRNDKWNIESKLFGLQTLGDDHTVVATYLMGKLVYSNKHI